MLTQFRMPVEDCIYEYKAMAGKIFGHPRWFSALGLSHPIRGRYSATTLSKAVETVVQRRVDNGAIFDDPLDVKFETGPGRCRGYDHLHLHFPLHAAKIQTRPVRIALTNVENAQRTLVTPNIIRSYGHGGEDAAYLKAGAMPVWMVARAATAAPLYFKKLELDIFQTNPQTGQGVTRLPRQIAYEPVGRRSAPSRLLQALRGKDIQYFREAFFDAGVDFRNNPCQDLLNEVEDEHQNPQVTLVSIGTARPARVGGDRAWQVLRAHIHDRSDPQPIHGNMERKAQRDTDRVHYFRLDRPGGLNVDLDHWKPRTNGDDTISAVDAAFHAWLDDTDNIEIIRGCARGLVALRRRRAQADQDRWDRFAVGKEYLCREMGDDGTQCLTPQRTRAQFVAHLAEEHEVEAHLRASRVDAGTSNWEYHRH